MHKRQQKPAQEQQLSKPLETASLSTETLHRVLEGILSGGLPICITVTGSSMQPFLYHARDRVFLSPVAPSHKIKRGDILLYVRDDGSWVMHRVYAIADGLLTMIGDGQWILEPNIRQEQVVAIALYALRKGKKISCERGMRNAVMKLCLYRMRAPKLLKRFVLGYVYVKASLKRVLRLLFVHCDHRKKPQKRK